MDGLAFIGGLQVFRHPNAATFDDERAVRVEGIDLDVPHPLRAAELLFVVIDVSNARGVEHGSGERRLPCLAAVAGMKQGSVFNTGINGVGVGGRRFKVPDALKLPGML